MKKIESYVPAGTAFYMSLPSGGDDTTLMASLSAQASAAWVASGRPKNRRVRVEFPRYATYFGALILYPGIEYIGNGSAIKKYSNPPGSSTAPADHFVCGTIPAYDSANSTWYGAADDISLDGFTFDANGMTMGISILFLANVRRCYVDNVTVIHSTGSNPCFGIKYNGQRVYFGPGVSVLGGRLVGQDGLHCTGGDFIEVQGGYYESGDDSIAFNNDGITLPDGTVYYDNEGVGPNISVIGPTVRALKAHAFRADYPSVAPPGNVGKIYGGVCIGMTGTAGIQRNGGISIIDNRVLGYDTVNKVVSFKVLDFDITVGSTDHDGVNTYGVNVQSASDVELRGTVRFAQPTQRRAGYQDVKFSSTVNGYGLCLLTAGTTYNFTIAVDGSAAQTVSVTAAAGYTFDQLIAAINAAMSSLSIGATCQLYTPGGSNTIRFVSNSRLAASAILLTAGTLFAAPLRYFSSISAAVPGATIPVFRLGDINTSSEIKAVVNATVPDGGGWNIFPYGSYGHNMHRNITIGGTLRMTATQTLPSVTVTSTPGLSLNDLRHEDIPTSQTQALKFFNGSIGPWTVVSLTPSASTNTASIVIAGDQTVVPLGSIFAIAGNTDRATNREYTVQSKTYSAGLNQTTFVVREPMSLTADVTTKLGFVLTPTTCVYSGGRFARPANYQGSLFANSVGINNANLGRFAYLEMRDVDFREVGKAITYTSGTDYLSAEYGEVVVRECPGIRTRYSGTATVGAAATSASVSLVGLIDVPLAGITAAATHDQIQIKPLSAPGTSKDFWVSITDVNTFVINVDVAPGGGGRTFGWTVDTSVKQ